MAKGYIVRPTISTRLWTRK